jgi:hypothetical protein
LATISNTPRPGYVWDATDNVWYPIGVGAHQHTNAADTPAVMPYSTYAAAGKNKILNGDFNINQRAFSSSTSNGYSFDRWYNAHGNGGTVTWSAQSFTAGTAPVSGYESKNFLRVVTSGQTATNVYTILQYRVEDVRTLAGQTATVSFWAKANTGTPKISIEVEQNFGTGGSPSSTVFTTVSASTISTSWARYSATFTIPSISGKTVGTDSNTSHLVLNLWISSGSDFNSRSSTIGIQSNTFDIWGVQLEAGSNVTAFQTATGNPASELAACQRYYYRQTSLDDIYSRFAMGSATATTNGQFLFSFPVQMRAKPSSLDISAASTFILWDGVNDNNVTAISGMTRQSVNNASIDFTTAATMTQYRPYWAISRNTTSAYVGFSAEL